MDKLVTIIVPVFNVEKYLEKSIKSIISQTYKKLEIILVDDGSTDLSGKICDMFSKKDKRVKTFHKTNGGLSDARNFGLDLSNGEYICFVDSDDTIQPNMIFNMLSIIESTNSDVCVCEFNYGLKNNYNANKKNKFKILNSNQSLIQMCNLKSKFEPNVCNKMFKKDFFEKIRFPKGKLFEDMIVTTKILSQSKKIVYLHNKLYNYNKREDSITTSFSLKEMDHINMTIETLKYIKENRIELEKYFIVLLCINYLSVFNKMIFSNKVDMNYYNESREYIKKNFNILIKINSISTIKKIQMIIYVYCIDLYIKILKIKNWRTDEKK